MLSQLHRRQQSAFTIVCLSAVIFLVGVSSAVARDYYVSTAGNDKNDGTSPASALQTLGAAVGKVAAGDTVYIAPGTYSENVTATLAGNDKQLIRFVGDPSGEMFKLPRGSVNITAASGWQLQFSDSAYLEFDSLTFTSASTDGVSLNRCTATKFENCEFNETRFGIYCVQGDVTVTSCDFIKQQSYGLLIDGALGKCSDSTFSRNGYGLYCSKSSGCTIDACRFDSNIDGSFVCNESKTLIRNCIMSGTRNYGALIVGAQSGSQIWNNTIANNRNYGIYFLKGEALFVNNIIAYSGGTGVYNNGCSLKHDHNLLFDNQKDFHGDELSGNEIKEDPLFVNVKLNDFHLTDDSPAVDAGMDGTGIVDFDLIGVKRPGDGGKKWDLGCYEHGAKAKGVTRIQEWQEVQ